VVRFIAIGMVLVSALIASVAQAQEIEESTVWIECGHQQIDSSVEELIALSTGSGVIVGGDDGNASWLLTARHVVDIEPPVNDKEWKSYCRAFPDGPTNSESWELQEPYFWPESVRLDAALFALDKAPHGVADRARSVCGENITSRLIAAGYPVLDASSEEGTSPHELGFVELPGEVHKNLPGSGILLSTHNFVQGMSGGPVLNSNGEVVGLVRGKFASQFSTIVPAYRLRTHLKDVANINEECSNNDITVAPLIDERKQLIARCRAAAAPRKTSCRAYDKSGLHDRPHGRCAMTLSAGSGRYFPKSVNSSVTVDEEFYRRIDGPTAVQAMKPQDNLVDGNNLTVAFSGTLACTNSRGTGRTCESRATVSAVSYPVECFEIEGELAK